MKTRLAYETYCLAALLAETKTCRMRAAITSLCVFAKANSLRQSVGTNLAKLIHYSKTFIVNVCCISNHDIRSCVRSNVLGVNRIHSRI